MCYAAAAAQPSPAAHARTAPPPSRLRAVVLPAAVGALTAQLHPIATVLAAPAMATVLVSFVQFLVGLLLLYVLTRAPDIVAQRTKVSFRAPNQCPRTLTRRFTERSAQMHARWRCAPSVPARDVGAFFDQQVDSAQWGGILFDPKNMSNRSPGLPETLVMLHSMASMPDEKFQTPKLGSHRFQLGPSGGSPDIELERIIYGISRMPYGDGHYGLDDDFERVVKALHKDLSNPDTRLDACPIPTDRTKSPLRQALCSLVRRIEVLAARELAKVPRYPAHKPPPRGPEQSPSHLPMSLVSLHVCIIYCSTRNTADIMLLLAGHLARIDKAPPLEALGISISKTSAKKMPMRINAETINNNDLELRAWVPLEPVVTCKPWVASRATREDVMNAGKPGRIGGGGQFEWWSGMGLRRGQYISFVVNQNMSPQFGTAWLPPSKESGRKDWRELWDEKHCPQTGNRRARRLEVHMRAVEDPVAVAKIKREAEKITRELRKQKPQPLIVDSDLDDEIFYYNEN